MANYYMIDDEGNKLHMEEVTEEKDLGVYISKNLKPGTQCRKAASKARSALSIVKRIEDFVIIYKTFIRPHLEYCIQA